MQNVISRLLDEREKLTELQTVEIIKLRASEMDSAAILLKIKQLSEQLSDLKKNQTSFKTNKAKQSYKKLSELEKARQKLHLQIESKRSELVDIAGQSQQDESAGYFIRHEKLISQKVSFDYRMQTLQESLNDLAKEVQRIDQLKKRIRKEAK